MYKPCGLWVAILALLGLVRSWGCFWIVSWSMIKPIGFWYLGIFECCKSLCFLQSNGLLVSWHCWGLPGLFFSSHWASDILTLLWLCQELGFELSYLQATGFLICSNQWISAFATWKHSCDWNLTCMFTLYTFGVHAWDQYSGAFCSAWKGAGQGQGGCAAWISPTCSKIWGQQLIHSCLQLINSCILVAGDWQSRDLCDDHQQLVTRAGIDDRYNYWSDMIWHAIQMEPCVG